ncbi:MAG TPA: helix-turn-helix domain-containing protein [Thermomicrobiales bacterium]|nr:helix-turn-helix domain-containing protein [Thermomicrobiales bacterium]
MTQTLESCAEVFVALADPSRRLLLERLAIDGPQSASALSLDVPISRQAVIKHLQHLAQVDLVQSQRKGREVVFIARAERLSATAKVLEQIGRSWDHRLDALKAAIEAQSAGDSFQSPV